MADYTTYYGERSGTTLCADHTRLLSTYDRLYICAYGLLDETMKRAIEALNRQLEAEMENLSNTPVVRAISI